MSREWSSAGRCAVCGGFHETPPVTPRSAPRVLQPARRLEALPKDLARTDAPRLVAELQESVITHALAEDPETDELVESILIRFRHAGVIGFAAWHNGVGQGVTLQRPMMRRTTVEQLRIELGTLQLQHVTCELPNCFQVIRATQAGRPRAHKNRAGQKCTLGRVLLNSPWPIGPQREEDS
jgi:hypothetical protein